MPRPSSHRLSLLALLLASLLALLLPVPALAAPGDPPAYAEIFDKAFEPGFKAETEEDLGDGTTEPRVTAFRVIGIGKVIITSGRIAAADPFVGLQTAKPFTQAVPTGAFPVRLAVGDHPAGETKDNRVSLARVDFTDRPTVRWSMAITREHDLATLKDGEIFGYGVDAGTGSFFDPAVQPAIDAIYAKNPEAYNDWQNEGEANGPKIIGQYSFVLMLPAGDANVAMFHSGWGDGFYASWFGYDADGNVTALVTDFNTIDWAKARWSSSGPPSIPPR
jgi:hypothetical protein